MREEPRQRRGLLRRLDFWLIVLGVASFGIGIFGAVLAYFALQEPMPEVIFETISETSVLDLRRPLQDLDIVFRGQNVQQQNLNMRIVTVNVANSGEIDILPGHYDHADDWGMKFNDAEVIEARLVDTNSDYLQSKIIPHHMNENTVVFPKVIFERGTFFAIEVLLLHKKDESPSISPIGKIAGISEITVLTRPLARPEISLIAELFQGSPLIQVLRIIIYFVVSVVSFLLAIIVGMTISEKFDDVKRRRRRKRISQTRAIRRIEQDEIRVILVDEYSSGGSASLVRLQELLNEPENISRITPPVRRETRGLHQPSDLPQVRELIDIDYDLIGLSNVWDALETAGIIEKGDDGNVVIDKTFGEVIGNLLSELDS